MSNNSPAPELIEAYNLIKAGQKPQAGKLLQAYIARSKSDPQAWWLMSHAVSDPIAARRCLETVLKLDPNHEQARERLAKLQRASRPAPAAPPPAPVVDDPFAPSAHVVTPAAPSLIQRASKPAAAAPPPVQRAPSAPKPAARPPSRPAGGYDAFPSDEMVLAGLTAPATTARDPFAPPSAAAGDEMGSFEDFLATDHTLDPFAAPPVDNPFEADPFAPPNAASASYDPFAPENVFDPSAGARLGTQTTTQAAGTGNQPGWGPGLAFVPDSTQEIGGAMEGIGGPILSADDLRVERRRRGGTNPFIIIGGFVAFFIIVGVIFAVMSMIGPREKVPSMTTMEHAAFDIDYPKGWDQRCEVERSGYPVCGMANHRWYNEVDYFAGTDIDLGEMFGDLFGFGFTGQDLPDEQVSIIAMDVPRTSPAYDDASWAKTLHEWGFSDATYSKKTMEVDGYEAYYYEFKNKASYYTWAAWDLYILHDDVVFWLRIDYSGDGKKAIPQKMVDKMIDSIDIK